MENKTEIANIETGKLEWLKSFGKKAVSTLKSTMITAVIIVAIGIGFEISEAWHYYQEKTKASSMQNSRKLPDTSVAINERQELMVINRKDGSYQIFQDSVGRMIFNLYASKIYTEIKEPVKK